MEAAKDTYYRDAEEVFGPAPQWDVGIIALSFAFIANASLLDEISPYRAPAFDSSIFSPQKIEELKKEPGGVLGLSVARRVDGSEAPVYIKKEHEKFTLHDFATDEQIGIAYVRYFTRKNRYYKDAFLGGIPKHLIGYGHEKRDVEKVELIHVENERRDAYKNVGVVLIKAILQFSNCGCRMVLDSRENTSFYYYKLGFRELDFQSKDLHPMYLPLESQKAWQKEIRENPILSMF